MLNTTVRTELRITYIGGPTALFELSGLRLLTDPTFDPAGTAYPTAVYTLRKSAGPAINLDDLGHIDGVLLSHDHHFDNLDHKGLSCLARADRVLTTTVGAQRLQGRAEGLVPWQTVEWPTPSGRLLHVTGTPARHGPADGDRGPVTGFLLSFPEAPEERLYISGDTVWYEGIAEIGRRFQIKTAVLFMGAAIVREVGPAHLTMTAADAVLAARAFPGAAIVPLHFEGWEHFTQSGREIQRAFAAAGLESRLRWLKPGVPQAIWPSS